MKNWGLIAVLAIVGFASQAFAQTKDLTGTWRGGYLCNNRETSLELRLTQSTNGRVTGEFEFGMGTQNHGLYTVVGDVNPSGRLKLEPQRWLQQPPGFSPVGLAADIGRDVIDGYISYANCSQFAVRRDGASTTMRAARRAPLLPVPRGPTPLPPGVDEATLAAAKPITTSQSDFFQPQPLNTLPTPVYVAGRKQALLVSPFAVYNAPLTKEELKTINFPYYVPDTSPELEDRAYVPYAGRHSEQRSEQLDGSITSWHAISSASPVPGLAHLYPRIYGPPALWAIDGFFFRSRDDLDHYLKRQPPGRLVEFLFFSYNARSREEVVFTLYAPLVGGSEEFDHQWAETAKNAPRFRSDVVNQIAAAWAATVLATAVESATKPKSLVEILEEAEERGRLCREAGGIC